MPGAGLDFTLDIADGEDQHIALSVVKMDTQRLEQALFNLESNAMKFTPRGGMVRIALAVNEVNPTRYEIISVQDSGTGIPPEQLEQIFERRVMVRRERYSMYRFLVL